MSGDLSLDDGSGGIDIRGVEGAAIASALSLALLNLFSLVSVRRRLAIDVVPLPFLPAPRERTGGAHG